VGAATGCLGLAHPWGRDQAHFARFFISGPLRRFLPKHKCFLCSPFYEKGVSLGHVGRN
jgi:hypothetical protein